MDAQNGDGSFIKKLNFAQEFFKGFLTLNYLIILFFYLLPNNFK